MSFEEEEETTEVKCLLIPLYQGQISMTCTADVDLAELADVVYVRFLHCSF